MTRRAKKLELSNKFSQKISHKTHVLYEFTAGFNNVKFR